jgi:hypothetical protein
MPTQDGDFIPWVKNIDAQVTLNQVAWGLNDMQVTKLSQLTESAAAKWEANSNPETANRRTSDEKKVAFSELKHFLSLFTESFYVNDAITDADMEAMGLRPRHAPAAQPKPEPESAEAPEVRAVVGQRHDVIVYVSKAQHGAPVQSLNTQYYGFMIRYRKEGESDWHQQMSTRLHATLYFEPEDARQKAALLRDMAQRKATARLRSDEISTPVN